MNRRTWIIGLAWSLPAALGWSQSPDTAPEPVQPSVAGTEAFALSSEAAFASDDVPLPVEAVVRTTETGDEVVEPASGNPFFLGFAAGPYYPPADERIDPLLLSQLRSQYDDGRPEAEVFAFAMFQRRITPGRVAELESLGVRVLGFHPHYTLRVAIPTGALESVAAMDFVRWVGVARDWQKVHPRLLQELGSAQANEPLDVYVSVFDSDLNELSVEERVGSYAVNDAGIVTESVEPESMGRRFQSNGWQQRALESVGVEVLEYIDDVDVFKARLYPASLDMILAQDNVQFVESVARDVLYDDESAPLVNGDWGRDTWDGSASGAVTMGIVDSGYDSSHTGLNHTYGFGWDYTGSGSPWTDLCGHGSHVSGTILGLPTSSNLGYTGMAPGLGTATSLRIFNVKNYDNSCTSAGTSHSTLYSHFRADRTDQNGVLSPRPQVINCSWGAPGIAWVGTEANARTLDTEVWNYHQMYVFAAGNGGPTIQSIGLPAVAKNAFTVGSVIDYKSNIGDPGTLWTSSSIGSAGDGRWKPNVVAPGRWIRSVDADTSGGYEDKAGTSAAAPHVTGLAAQLTEHFGFMRYKPHRMASALMLSALTKDNETLNQPTASHLDRYGTGRVDGQMVHNTPWTSWEFLHNGSSTTYHYDDFEVPVGTDRLIVCMAYHERAGSAGASEALVNDLDLWIDRHPVDPGGDSGEYFTHQSRINNTEIRYLENPIAGTYRWKVYPDSVTQTTRVSVTVLAVQNDTTPSGSLTLTADETCIQPNEDVEIDARVTGNGFIGSAVFLDSTAPGATFQEATTELLDGIDTDLMTNQHSGRDILLGNLPRNGQRWGGWTVRWASEGQKTFSVEGRADNMATMQDSVTVTVDGTPPGLAGNLQSTSHTPGVWSNERNVVFSWNPAPDALSGLDGYSYSVSSNGPSLPNQTKDLGTVTFHTEQFSSSSSPQYFNLRSVDCSGNWDNAAASDGGFLIDAQAPSPAKDLQSPSHNPGQSTCEGKIVMQWTPAIDGLSGLAGYRGVFTTSPTTIPIGALNLGPTDTQYVEALTNGTWFFHLRARDVAGNWGKTAHSGPYVINFVPPQTYCTPKKNSCGSFPSIAYTGLPRASASSGFVVRCNSAKAGKAGLLVYTTAGPAAIPFQGGLLCITPNPLKRTVSVFDNTGTGQNCDGRLQIDMNAFAAGNLGGNPLPALRNPGQRINCQWWGRDTIAQASLLSDGLEYTVCP